MTTTTTAKMQRKKSMCRTNICISIDCLQFTLCIAVLDGRVHICAYIVLHFQLKLCLNGVWRTFGRLFKWLFVLSRTTHTLLDCVTYFCSFRLSFTCLAVTRSICSLYVMYSNVNLYIRHLIRSLAAYFYFVSTEKNKKKKKTTFRWNHKFSIHFYRILPASMVVCFFDFSIARLFVWLLMAWRSRQPSTMSFSSPFFHTMSSSIAYTISNLRRVRRVQFAARLFHILHWIYWVVRSSTLMNVHTYEHTNELVVCEVCQTRFEWIQWSYFSNDMMMISTSAPPSRHRRRLFSLSQKSVHSTDRPTDWWPVPATTPTKNKLTIEFWALFFEILFQTNIKPLNSNNIDYIFFLLMIRCYAVTFRVCISFSSLFSLSIFHSFCLYSLPSCCCACSVCLFHFGFYVSNWMGERHKNNDTFFYCRPKWMHHSHTPHHTAPHSNDNEERKILVHSNA